MERYWMLCKIWIFRGENKNRNILGYLASEITINTDNDQGHSISTKWRLIAQYWRNYVPSTVLILNLPMHDLVQATLQLTTDSQPVCPPWRRALVGFMIRYIVVMLNNAVSVTRGVLNLELLFCPLFPISERALSLKGYTLRPLVLPIGVVLRSNDYSALVE